MIERSTGSARRDQKLARPGLALPAAALAVLASVGLIVANSADEPAGPEPSAGPSEGPADSTPETGAAAPGGWSSLVDLVGPPKPWTPFQWVQQLPDGRSPRIAYQAGPDLVAPDGTVTVSDRVNPLTSFVRYRGTVVGTDLAEGAPSRRERLGVRRVVDGGCSLGPPAVSSDRSAVYWSVGSCDYSGAGGAASIFSAGLDGVDDPTSVHIEGSDGRGVRVLGPVTDDADGDDSLIAYNVSGGPDAGLWVTDLESSFHQVHEVTRGLDATSTGLIAAEKGERVVVLDEASGEVLWGVRRPAGPAETASFSPDGRHLLLGRNLFDARTGTWLSKLHSRGALSAPVWEDDEHLLLGVDGPGGNAAVVRYDLEGTPELAVDWRAGRTGRQPTDMGFEVLS